MKLKFIYNPVSGNGVLRNNLDYIIERFQTRGVQLLPYKLLSKNDIKNAFDEKFNEYEGVVAAGGDGTVHDVVNQMKEHNIDLPLGIVPSGTSNDFASFLELPKDISKCIDTITIKRNIEYIDLGRVNNKYFVNVVSGGILSSIAHKTDKNLKNSIGMFAYYIKALEEIPKLKHFDVKMTCDGAEINEKSLIFLVLNSSIAGGFKIAPKAKINDGLLDVCIFKKCALPDFGALFIKLVRGEHINDERFISIQAKNISIDCNKRIDTDIDGEKGRECPLDICVAPKALRVFK